MAEAEDPETPPRKKPVVPPPPPPTIFCRPSSRMASSQSRLRNFSFPSLKRGNRQLLRCINLECGAKADGGSPAPDHRLTPAVKGKRSLFSSSYSPALVSAAPSSSRLEGRLGRKTREWGPDREMEEAAAEEDDEEEEEKEREDEGLERFKLKRNKLPPAATEKGKEEPEAAAEAAEASEPWNLRLRQAGCNTPAIEKGGRSHQSQNPSSLAEPEKKLAAKYSGRLRSEAPERKARAEFLPFLSREEIVEDFVAITGSKPPRRPRRRLKNVQNQLDLFYPGFWLTNVAKYWIP